MRLLLQILLFSSLCVAQTPQPVLPAEVPIENEPHHHLVFENEYVRVFKVEVAPHEATLVHRHKRDYVVVTIGDAEVTNAVVGKEPKKWTFKDGDVTFLEASGEKSFAHKAVNEGGKPFVNYTIELKKSVPVEKVNDQNSPNVITGECANSVISGDAFGCGELVLYIQDGLRISRIYDVQPSGNHQDSFFEARTFVITVRGTQTWRAGSWRKAGKWKAGSWRKIDKELKLWLGNMPNEAVVLHWPRPPKKHT